MFGVYLWHIFIHIYSEYLQKMLRILSRYEKTTVNCVFLQTHAYFSAAQFSQVE